MAKRRQDPRRRPRRLVSTTIPMDEACRPAEAGAPLPSTATPGGDRTAVAASPQAAALPPVTPDDGARTFGDGERAWVVAAVSGDRQQVVVTALALNGLATTAKGLARELSRAYGLKATFDGKVLRQLIEAAAGTVIRGSFPVARGTPAEPGVEGRVEIACAGGKREGSTQALGADFAAALASKTLEEVLATNPSGVLVAPGQAIARLVPPTVGKAGRDVLGQEVVVPGATAQAEAGRGVRLEGDGLVAGTFGYARRRGDTFEVVPPIWVSADAMAAYFVHFPELLRQRAYEPAWIAGALAEAGVTYGVDADAIAALCAAWPPATQCQAIPLARGTPAQDGVDTHVEYETDPAKRAGAVRPDGSIDFRERNHVIGVAAGQKLGHLVGATPGRPGADVRGNQLPARDGEERPIAAGANVTCQTEDGALAYYSQIDGALTVGADAVEVQPIFAIAGDVGYDTGNIDLPMNVEISGSVQSGFTVKAEGSVVIAGTLEPGARVTAGGDVVVAKGIFGDATRVAAKGDVETKLIQNSSVSAQGDVTVGSYIYNGHVLAGGEVAVEEGGGSRAGSIVGGEVIAGRRVRAKTIGSAQTDRTLVGIGEAPEARRQRIEAERGVRERNREISGLVDELGLRGATAAEMAARVARCEAAERGQVEAKVARLQSALAAKEKAQADLARLEEECAAALRQATVRAQSIFPDVQIDFGGDVSRVDARLANAEFYRSDHGLRWRPT